MTDRERLVELIDDCRCMDGYGIDLVEKQADHLLANGVILSPCEVGQKVFLILEKVSGGADIVESYCCKIVDKGHGKVYSIHFDCAEIGNTLEYTIDEFGVSVFLTKEEAERALKERESNA